MKNKIFILIFLITSILWTSIAEAQQGRYVRKNIQPDFFIPNSAVEKPEKLPPLEAYREAKPVPKPQENKVEENAYTLDEEDDDSDYAYYEDEEGEEETVNIEPRTKRYSEKSAYLDILRKTSPNEKAEYKEKFDDYLDDLKVIGKTGKAPRNPVLEKDLADMSSNSKILVDSNFNR